MNTQDWSPLGWTGWLDLLAVQGTPKSLLQHHSSKALILWRSAFFIVQLSHAYMTIGKTIALTRWTFVGKVMSLLLLVLRMVKNVESRLTDLDSWVVRGNGTILLRYSEYEYIGRNRFLKDVSLLENLNLQCLYI